MSDNEERTQHFILDPRKFISPPYKQCPKCHVDDSFGVLMIQDFHYIRRCRECWHTQSYGLPEIKKRVLYLDQFAISNMMKALYPSTDLRQRDDNMYWRRLFRLLDKLCKLQLLICPDSEFHTQESLTSPFPDALKRMYEMLSGGVTLHHSHSIEMAQIYEHIQRWVTGEELRVWKFDISEIVSGNMNRWQDKFIITMEWPNQDEWTADIRRSREVINEDMIEIFERWKREKKDFKYWFSEEAKAYGIATVEIYLRYLQRWKDMANSVIETDIRSFFPPLAAQLVQIAEEGLKKAGVDEKEVLPIIIQYFLSDAMESVPFIRIRAMLTAAIARQAAAGRKQPPSRGIINDIKLISAYLPYLDSIFIDNECRGYLIEEPLRSELTYECKVFSQNVKDELFDYLQEIEQNASSEHFATVGEIYGEDWLKPYETMYEKE